MFMAQQKASKHGVDRMRGEKVVEDVTEEMVVWSCGGFKVFVHILDCKTVRWEVTGGFCSGGITLPNLKCLCL